MQSIVDTLNLISSSDNLAADRSQGVCPIPTYELTDSDWDLFQNRSNIDGVQERLKQLDIYQYFFPSSDKFALGMIDYRPSNEQDLAESIEKAKSTGHRFLGNDLIKEASDVSDVIGMLKELGYVAEGEMALQLTADGKSIRKELKFRPSESLFEKISKIMSVKLNIEI